MGREEYHLLYDVWESSDYDTNLAPSCDRVDDYKPYTIHNIRLGTWENNRANHHSARKAGKNNKASKRTVQLSSGGEYLSEFASSSEAGRCTKIAVASISACCRGERLSAGGYKWRYVPQPTKTSA